MTLPDIQPVRCFKVIECSRGPRPRRTDPVALPAAPILSSQELAADMADLFLAGLVAAHPFESMADPHAVVAVTPGTAVSLHEMLCQVRTLAWSDAAVPLADGPSGYGPVAHQRRVLRWNGDRQLTLGTLFRSGVALPVGRAGLSRIYETDSAVAPVEGPLEAPEESVALSVWSRWCAAHAGAGLRLPGEKSPSAPIHTPAEMARHILDAPAGRPYYAAALSALAQDVGMDAGLGAAPVWRGGRLLSLLARVERRARLAAVTRLAVQERLMRPAVTAARMTVYLAREERHCDPAQDLYRRAADELALAAPDLLSWVSGANLQARARARFERTLFLPLGASNTPSHPSDAAAHVVVAGAMATVLKAVLDTREPRRLRLGARAGDAMDLALELDKAVSNTALARCVTAGYFPAENHQDMRLGQSIALHALREVLEADNRDATLSFRDFDGRTLRLRAKARSFGRGFAELRVGSTGIQWPQDAAEPGAHLTAVV
ncbi:hypothetical protein [Tropicibacter sp. S64]|uniref:hypothetical protein n=1 Tax=Tropicibacter sp. S64 TaxID=3415122 RepID=UPI003C7A7474